MSKPLAHAEVINHMADPKQHCQTIRMRPLPDGMRKVMESNISELYGDDDQPIKFKVTWTEGVILPCTSSPL